MGIGSPWYDHPVYILSFNGTSVGGSRGASSGFRAGFSIGVFTGFSVGGSGGVSDGSRIGTSAGDGFGSSVIINPPHGSAQWDLGHWLARRQVSLRVCATRLWGPLVAFSFCHHLAWSFYSPDGQTWGLDGKRPSANWAFNALSV